MSSFVHESVSLLTGSIQNVSIATASGTNAAALPTTAIGFQITAGCDLYISWIGSASTSAATATGLYVAGKTTRFFDSGPSKVINLVAYTSANPMIVNIVPYA